MSEKILERINLQLFGGEGEPEDTAPEDEEKDKAGEGDESGKEEEPQDVKKYTDGDVDEIVKKKIGEERKKASEAVKEAEKLAKMNAEQKKDYELEKLRAEVEELKAKENKSEMIKIARGMLTDESINVNDELLSFLVTAEAETTKENVDSFKTAFKTAVDNAVTEKLKGKTPTKSGATAQITNDKKLTEITTEEQVALHQSNPELFAKLLSEI